MIDDKKTVTWIKDIQISIKVLLEWTIPEKTQTGGWGHGIPRGIKEITYISPKD